MYVKLHREGNQWFRDDNGTLVGETVNTYFNTYYNFKTPIIKTPDWTYVRPVYGRINSKTGKFVALCEGKLTRLCVGRSCRGFSSDPLACPLHQKTPTDGYYIIVD